MNLKNWVSVLFVLVISASPYIANYSIAMWRDPIFSVAVALLIIKLTDAVIRIQLDRSLVSSDLIFIVILSLTILFLRNNGFYIVLLLTFNLCVYFIFCLYKRKNKKISILKLFLCSLATILIFLTITGPIYNYFNIKQVEKVESYGTAVNSMAYVYLNNGNLDDSDLDYINQLIPLEDIEANYSPFIVDKLKWSKNFNDNVLYDNFIGRYFKIFVNNPALCIESIFQGNFGFWSINHPDVWSFSDTIYYGAPRNFPETRPENDVLHNDVEFANLFNLDEAYNIFPIRNVCIPISIINWFILFFVIAALLMKRYRYVIFLTPIFVLFATLIIASPIWYWPRYELAAQLLIPYLIFLIYLFRHDIKTKNKISKTN